MLATFTTLSPRYDSLTNMFRLLLCVQLQHFNFLFLSRA
jgi:hypothetical protein